MKHSVKIVSILIAMFIIAQLIGIAVNHSYSPKVQEVTINNTVQNVTSYNLPYGTSPPSEVSPTSTLISIIVAIAFAVLVILLLMRFKAEVFLRGWFFVVVVFAMGVTLNAGLYHLIPYSALVSLAIAIPLGIFKIFKRNIIVHNLTELIVYPGIAAIFVPLLNIWAAVILLILISIYDMYAVWKAGFMQKMAKYQIQKVKVFGGFFVPYLGKEQSALLKRLRASKSKSKLSKTKLKISLAVLGGGDVAFPMIFAGVVLQHFGFISALIVVLFAVLALTGLFIASKKGKFYPAMPFLTIGCFIGLGIVYLLSIL